MNRIDGKDRTHIIVMGDIEFKRLFTEYDARIMCSRLNQYSRRRRFHWKRVVWDY